jgi:hypothetical protein
VRTFGVIFGLAAPFGVEGNPAGSGTSTFRSGCFDDAIEDRRVEAWINHSRPAVGSVADGSLRLYQAECGLVACLVLDRLADSNLAEALRHQAREQEFHGWSCGWTSDRDTDISYRRHASGAAVEDYRHLRRLFEVSIMAGVARPAFGSTWCLHANLEDDVLVRAAASLTEVPGLRHSRVSFDQLARIDAGLGRLRRETIEALEARYGNGIDGISDELDGVRRRNRALARTFPRSERASNSKNDLRRIYFSKAQPALKPSAPAPAAPRYGVMRARKTCQACARSFVAEGYSASALVWGHELCDSCRKKLDAHGELRDANGMSRRVWL